MEVAFSPELQQETRTLDERIEHGSDNKNEELFNNVKGNQDCSLQKLKAENHNKEEDEDRHDVLKVVCPVDGSLDGVAPSTPPLGEDPSCRICLEGDTSSENQFLKLPCHCIGSSAHVHTLCFLRWFGVRSSTQNQHTCEVCLCDMKTFIMEMLQQFPAQHQENLEILYQNHCEYVIGMPALEDVTDFISYTLEDMEGPSSTCEALLILLTGILVALLTYLWVVCSQ